MFLLAKQSIMAAVLVGLVSTAAADIGRDDSLYFSWDGYRIAHYRSPPTAPPEGGKRIDTPALRAMLAQEQKPVLIDVQPVGWQDGIFLITQPRYHLPGSLWLPNVGLGEPSQQLVHYFRVHLQRATGDDYQHPVVLYCTADCWMSWNAIKRASTWGYRNLYWYAEGTDGWHEAGLDLVEGTPVPLPAND